MQTSADSNNIQTARADRWATFPLSLTKVLTVLILALAAGLLVVACQSDSYATLNRQGTERYEQKDYRGALDAYRQAQVQRPDLPQLNFNVGNALYRMREYARASDETRRALTAEDPSILAQAYYNLGNQYFRAGQLQEAYTAYKNALIYNPNDQDAKYNLEVVLMLLQSVQQPPGSGQQPGNGNSQSTPNPATATPGAGDQPPARLTPENGPIVGENPADQPNSGEGGTQGERFDSIEQAEQALSSALSLGEDSGQFTIEEALRVLDVLAERQRLRESQEQPPSSPRGYRDW